MTPVTDVLRGVVGRLGVDERLARLEYLPVEGHDGRRKHRDHFLQRAARMFLRRQAVERRKRVIDADVAELAIQEADPHRRRHEQSVELRIRLLCGPEETRVVDRECGTPRDLVRELEVRRPEAASGLARTERDRPEQPAARLERDDDIGHRLEGLVEGEMLLVDSRMGERLAARILDQDRLAAGEHLRHGVRLVRLGRVAAPHLAQQLFALRVSVRDDDLPQARLVLADRVDDAVVGDPRDK